MTHVKLNKECSTGNHNFIVSRWLLSTGSQTAASYSCQHCLLIVEGRDQIDKLRAQIHESVEPSVTATHLESVREQSSKGSNRKREET